jgi:O-antigen ligase
MLGWRVEAIAAVVILGFTAYTYFSGSKIPPMDLTERMFIILPMVTLIAWSGLSMSWAESPKSSLQHTLTWSLYLIFYIFTRQVLQDRGSTSKVLTTFAICLMIFGALAFLAQITLIFVGKSTQIGVIYSKFAEQAVTILPLFLFGVLRANGNRFRLGVVGVSLLWLLVFCSSSRTANGLFILCILLTGISVFAIRSLQPYRRNFAIACLPILFLPIGLIALSASGGSGDVLVVARAQDSQQLRGSNDFRRLVYQLSWDMFTHSPVLGVGAGNFGSEVNRYRISHSQTNPTDPLLAQAESNVPERTHNEYLQIAAELGIVGIFIFAWFLLGVAILGFRALRTISSIPPQALAACLGLGLFLASSLVTSYSFRLVQNGFTFFFVLAVASKILIRKPKAEKVVVERRPLRFTFAAAAACVALISLCGIRVASTIYTDSANSNANLDEAAVSYNTAMALDRENPDPPYALGRRLIEAGRYSEAVPFLRRSIDIGRASSTDYSYLATAQTLAGDATGAEATFAEAATMYPRSPFVLARYSALLEINGKHDEAERNFAKAQEIDITSANTWRALITRGSKYASDLALNRKDHMAVMDLQPYDSIYAVVEERDIRYPDERAKLPFEKFH